jgi:hypothetical protein
MGMHTAGQSGACKAPAAPHFQTLWSLSSLTQAPAPKSSLWPEAPWTQIWASRAASARVLAGFLLGQPKCPHPFLGLQQPPSKCPQTGYIGNQGPMGQGRGDPASPSPSGEGSKACTGADAQACCLVLTGHMHTMGVLAGGHCSYLHVAGLHQPGGGRAGWGDQEAGAPEQAGGQTPSHTDSRQGIGTGKVWSRCKG